MTSADPTLPRPDRIEPPGTQPPGTQPPRSQLHAVPADRTDRTDRSEQPADRPGLMRVCGGEPLLLTRKDETVLDLINRSRQLRDAYFAADARPDGHADQYQVAEVILESVCTAYGTFRTGEGARVKNVVSLTTRYLLPAGVERDLLAAPGRRGMAGFHVLEAELIPQQLAGLLELPAATVVGMRLGRSAVRCLWLSKSDAAKVTVGGAPALEAAVHVGQVPVHVDARTGRDVIAAAHLRGAGLLAELPSAHGLAKSTATNVVRLFNEAMRRAEKHGANIRGDLSVRAMDPLAPDRLRAVVVRPKRVSLAAVRQVCADLPVVMQVALWLMRLTGMRISEAYGLHVGDYGRDPETGLAVVVIHRQGGDVKWARNPDTGQVVPRPEKEGAKAASDRTIPVAEPLARLLDVVIDVFHTTDGQVDLDARLVPGIGKDDEAGEAAFRSRLKGALGAHDEDFNPHAMRSALLNDLKDAGVKKKLRFAYLGHLPEGKDIQEKHYLAPRTVAAYRPVLEVIEAACEAALLPVQAGREGGVDLRVPTRKREAWRRAATRVWPRRTELDRALVGMGWRLPPTADMSAADLTSEQVAARLGVTERTAHRLMSTQRIRSRTVACGRRQMWVASVSDVAAYERVAGGVSLSDLAHQEGVSYHHLWHLVRNMTLVPGGHARGQAVRLPPAAVAAVRVELARRRALHSRSVTVAEAAEKLDVPPATVGTLLQAGHLDRVPAPDGRRARYVSLASIDLYNASYPGWKGPVAAEEVLLPFMAAARLMKVSRPTLSQLCQSRQVRVTRKPGSRHAYVTASSVRDWALRRGARSVVAAVDAQVAHAAHAETGRPVAPTPGTVTGGVRSAIGKTNS